MFHTHSARSGSVKLVVAATILLLLLTAWTTNSTIALANGTVKAVANLHHTPTGTANLQVGREGHTLTVTISLTGLAPNSTHPAHIHGGICTSNGPILYTLNNVVANNKGQASSTTILYSKDGWSIPETGWYVNVHNGPTLNTPQQAYAIACGVVSNPDDSSSMLIHMGPTPNPNQNATGYAHLKIEDGDLVVTIYVQGLAPNSEHAAHIHAGHCFYTQQVLYDLSPLKADGNGNVYKSVTFSDVSSIPASGWDVNVHFGTDLSTQTGYDPILCGNVVK